MRFRDARQQFEMALADIERGDTESARQKLDTIVAAAPDFPEARLGLAILLGSSGERDNARRHIVHALESLDGDTRLEAAGLRAQSLLNLCSLAVEDGDWQEAHAWEAMFSSAKEDLRQHGILQRASAVLFSAANLAVRDEEHESAQVLYARAVDLDPTFAEGWHNLAVLALQRGEPEEAEALARRAVEADPTFADAQFLLGSIALSTDISEAVEHMERAVRSTPDNAEWLSVLASAHVRTRNFSRARELYANAILIDENRADAHLGFAIASRGLGDIESARFALRRAFELNPQLAASIENMMSAQ